MLNVNAGVYPDLWTYIYVQLTFSYASTLES